ncbi:membrane protein insertase YidC [Acidipropionibacterium acidipropionici]|jgi:YidC/Oxa1 family membrane protein insertase|uniref:Membrane protein insertase YidC n=2 Tax=Acidipropionibacterium acidipropionici TaxID=1748 RepID=A0A142KI14_9ACTN|nr:membrane protein insertase YidC [Acidipropionibacterium acidipropionici]AFV91187.1 Membrane protein insertase, YidC/Oxa1 family [Acidipropionibacterium acidipropionici ATCC 4875]ALN14756.1 preprotein translocase YidC [Acidipropionibacterium acidipropionici]AMS05752.1 preprotein translocase YidC [Acidipropionibacterium acidipropionici]AOZ47219.1 membrane protein insertase YidC [Acidipropionibacterium acidipropionici]APZ09490.1 membrane protein insertase YidC [Acidipropionibacterium acidiprop
MMSPMVILGLWDGIQSIGHAIMIPLYWAVSGLLVLFHNLWSSVLGQSSGWAWALAIIFLTIFIRILLIPLFVKQINSSRSMQAIQPKMKAIQDKYGDDRERAGQEMMNLYKEEGVNPSASCLPLLLQMPIFLALFRVLDGASRGIARGKFMVDNPDLVSSLQHTKIFGAELAGRFLPINNGFGATQIVALVLIIILVVSLFYTQLQLMRKNMPPESLTGPMAQQQKMMVYLFPLMYLFTGLSFPIGVMLYWSASNIWTLGQQEILIRNNPTPNTPAYIDWQERMRAKGKDPDEIERERREKRRRKKVTATPVAVADPADPNSRPMVARQGGVARQTVRKTADGGTQVVRRQQPARQSRAKRKH